MAEKWEGQSGETTLAVYEDMPTDLALRPVINLELAKKRLEEFQQFVKFYLVENEDFGTIPGTPKPTLYKSGADKLCDIYGLADDYQIEDKTEDFDSGLFDYTIKCRLMRKGDGSLVATGLGSCNSYEGRYRWREKGRNCLSCSAKETIIKGKEEYGGGWLCYKKRGGCGKKYADGDKAIESQTTEKVQNEDIASLKNTILKMAKKRAKVDATLAATRSSGVFTQDLDDLQRPVHDDDTPTSRPVASGVTSGAGDRQPIQQPKPKAQNPGQPISEAQGKRIWGIAKQAYGSDTAAKEAKVKAVLAAFGFEKQTDVTRDVYEALCEAIANLSWQAPAPVQNLDVQIETMNIEGEVVQVVDKRTDKTPHMSLSISGGFEIGTSDTVLWPIVENAKGKQGLFKCARKKGTPNPQRLKLLEILRLEEVIRYDKSESQAPAIDWEV